jgi:hypothetical protein
MTKITPSIDVAIWVGLLQGSYQLQSPKMFIMFYQRIAQLYVSATELSSLKYIKSNLQLLFHFLYG